MRHRYLRPSWDLPEIYLYRQPIDFRKQANGLALIVEQELGHSPFSGALYAFTNRQRNKIKCLMWEDNGFVLYYKSLAEEKFKWPGLQRPLHSDPLLPRPRLHLPSPHPRSSSPGRGGV